MKKYIFLLIIIPFLTSCGAGGGGGVVNNPGGGDDGTSNKPNSACSGSSNIAKIKIKEDGIYRVTYSALCSAGINLSGTDITTLKMTNQKDEVAIDVVDSSSNGVFDDGDYAEFYGKALGRDDSRFRFTETNVYWLSVGEKTGKRIEKVIPPLLPPFPNFSFAKHLHMEGDTWYVQENYPEITSPSDIREHWFWGERIYPEDKITQTFSTRYIDRSVPVSLKIRLQSVSLNHYTKVYVNGKLVSEKIWDSKNPYDIEISGVDPSIFYNSGLNNLTIESAGGGLFYLDWFEVNYNREFKAEHNIIEFTGKDFIKLSGFSSQDISLYEISDPANVQKINISEPKKTVAGDYEVSFSSPYDSEGLFMAITSDQKKSPVVESYTPSDITSRPADYIIITHEDFSDAIKALADYRALQGYNVLTVRVRDVYDEFSYGIEDPHAIRDFLSYAYKNKNWSAKYVLLVGDATIDYKDLLGNGAGYGVKNYIPAYLYNYSGLGEVPSDNWFADVDEANGVLPEMNIGRIPAKTKADVTVVVNKIISHESSSVSSNKILLVADTAKKDDGSPAPDSEQIFEILSDSIAELTPFPAYLQSKLYRRNYPGDLKEGLISAISDGQLIVNYSGHGSVTDWTNDDIFSSEDVAKLSNNDYPFVVALNCMNGYFMLPNDGIVLDSVKQNPSISESFLLGEGKGALAVWAASSIGYPSEHDPLAKALYNLIFNEDVTVLGDAVTEAKKRAYSNNDIMDDVVQTFIFFGDPATRLK